MASIRVSHCPVLHGIYRTTEGLPVFHAVHAPTDVALEFIQRRLAALVPRPRLHLIRFHGVLAPNARLRPDIIPNLPANANTPQRTTLPRRLTP